MLFSREGILRPKMFCVMVKVRGVCWGFAGDMNYLCNKYNIAHFNGKRSCCNFCPANRTAHPITDVTVAARYKRLLQRRRLQIELIVHGVSKGLGGGMHAWTSCTTGHWEFSYTCLEAFFGSLSTWAHTRVLCTTSEITDKIWLDIRAEYDRYAHLLIHHPSYQNAWLDVCANSACKVDGARLAN